MLNKQLRRNVKALDLQIGQLTNEINGMVKDTKYDIKMRTLDDLAELRCKLIKGLKEGETSDVILELDKQIEDLTMIVVKLQSDVGYVEKMKKLEELTKARAQLSDVKSKESHASLVIPGLIGLSGLVLLLAFEKSDVITSKGSLNMVMKMFRGV